MAGRRGGPAAGEAAAVAESEPDRTAASGLGDQQVELRSGAMSITYLLSVLASGLALLLWPAHGAQNKPEKQAIHSVQQARPSADADVNEDEREMDMDVDMDMDGDMDMNVEVEEPQVDMDIDHDEADM